MSRICRLSTSVINKIAAGEVIERPASVLKELVENALDAGATRIDVAVARGGLDQVRVADNGAGIEAEDLPLAVASHATSKIREADDLFRVGTLGFRGEALASIAEVSRLVIRSRTAQAGGGTQLEVAGGRAEPPGPCGCAVGTTVDVRDLFFNTPVRRKFLRTTQTEMGHLSEAFTRLALAFPRVHFTLAHHERTLFDLPPCDDVRQRVAAFFGDDVAADLIAVDSRDDEVLLSGYVGSPAQSRANARTQYLFLNGRAIRDRALQHALGEAYRGLLMTGRHPVAFLRVEMPPELVDVNVHPTKLEVRFADSGRLYGQLLATLRNRFLSTDLTARLQPAADWRQAESGQAWAAPRDEARRDLVEWVKGELTLSAMAVASAGPADHNGTTGAADEGAPPGPLELVALDRQWQSVGLPDEDELRAPPELAEEPGLGLLRPVAGATSWPTAGSGSPQWRADSAHDAAGVPAAAFGEPAPDAGERGFTAAVAPAPALQVHNRYLVAECPEGVVVIDQHALHERILYEELRARVYAGPLESQRLLVPEPVDLAPAEAAAALDARELLAKLGVSIEPFGGDTLLVTSYPAMLANWNPAAVLRELVEHVLAGPKGPERQDLLDELLHMIACKAAIKAGDHLTPEEIAALLERRHLARDSHHCPHGRPTSLVFTREELDRQFKRT